MDRQERSKRDRPPGKRFEPREPREKKPDPNSPFAKLAVLKAQLEADAKERR
jgi:ATP-dependent RNA helicase SUPV3L1/SUV3